ncbi:hypothetical protein LJC47_06850 [Desulfosarcina sp. OttesenSCG-928-B08]|nr:hypothetical protein [Desulfosarcina sp. OttesenSCG-928-B08]
MFGAIAGPETISSKTRCNHMSDPVSLQKNQEPIIERWKKSSPFEQRRLEILKQAIEEGKERELYDPEEQRKFGIEKDEYLVCAQFYRHVPPGVSLGNTVTFLLLIMAPIMIAINMLSEGMPCIELLKNSIAYNMLCIIYCTGIIIFIWTSGSVVYRRFNIIFITNKNIYHSIDPLFDFSKQKSKKISLNAVSIKHSINSAAAWLISDDSLEYMEIPLELFFIQDEKVLLKIDTGKYFRSFIKKYKISGIRRENLYTINTMYMLTVLSYISKIYNAHLYIYPIHCGFACIRKKNKFVSDYKKYIFGRPLFIKEMPFKNAVTLRKDIEKKFSTLTDLEKHLTQLKKHSGLNKEKIIRILQEEPLTEKELHEVLYSIPAKKSLLGKTHIIYFSKKNIWVERNGKIVMKKFCFHDVDIYNSHKYFIFIRKGGSIVFYSLKKNINFPFVDITELLFNKKIEYADSPFTKWES